MKVVELRAFAINIPFQTAFVSSLGALPGTTRTLVELVTDEGITGIGETMQGKPVLQVLERLRPLIVGYDPFDIEAFLRRARMIPFFHGYTGYCGIGAVEMACWDALGKALGVPLYRLLGGKVRDRVAVTGLAFVPLGARELVAAMLEHIDGQVRRFGFRTVKLKGSHDAVRDVQLLEALRRHFGDEMALRVDPNGAWTADEAIRMGPRLLPLRLQWLEDPVWGLESMARLRRDVPIPQATNMWVVSPEHIAPAVRMQAVDVILGDCHKWGGILPTKKLAGVCEAFDIGMGLHSGSEAGVSTAAYLHIAASTPAIRYAIDSVYPMFTGDVITRPFQVKDGELEVPDGPGLGVEIDPDQVARYRRLHEEHGDYVT